MTRICVLLAGFAAAAAPANADACGLLDWFRGRRTAYAPAVPNYSAYRVPPCSTCTTTCTRRVCNYVPQTAYRTSYVTTPVTTYRPTYSSNPCTGCTTTCMRPVTTYVQRPTLVPYTTYRQVCNTVTTQPTTTYYAQPAYSAQPAPAASGCSTCGVTPASYAAPVGAAPLSYGATAPTTAPTIGADTYVPPATSNYSPITRPLSSAAPASPGGSVGSSGLGVPATPEASSGSPTEAETQGSSLRFDNGPDLSDPLDKTAYQQHGGWRVYQTASQRTAQPPAPTVQRGGWRVAE